MDMGFEKIEFISIKDHDNNHDKQWQYIKHITANSKILSGQLCHDNCISDIKGCKRKQH